MITARAALLAIVVASVFPACTESPTSPSAVAPAVAVPTPTSVAIPPRLTVTPPRAIGLTRYDAFGDSITWGALSAFEGSFAYAMAGGGYVERLEAGLNTFHAPQRFSVFNDGLPGEAAINAVTRFRNMLTTRRPEAVLLLEGINDINNGISVMSVGTALRQMLDAAAFVGVPVLIATMYQTYEVVDPNGRLRTNGATVVPALNAEIRQLAAGRVNVFLVDLEPVMRDRNLVGGDGIHTTEAGFEVMSSTFMTAIEAAFPVRGSFQ